MMPPGAFRAGRRRDELLEEREWLARPGHRADAAQRVQRPRPVGRDLVLQLLARAELVEDLADPLDARRRQRGRRREEGGELGPRARRGLLERDDDREGLLALHQVVHLELAGALGGGPDPEKVVVRLERLAEVVAEARERLADLRVLGRQHGGTLGARGDERAGLLRGHGPVALHGDVGPVLEADVQELPFADADAGLVGQAREVEDPVGGEAPLAEPLHGET
jgi:hypothetical protein